MGREGAAFLRDELGQQIGFAVCNQLLDLLLRNFALQNDFAHPEGTRLGCSDRVFASVGIIEHVDLALLANRAETEHLVPRRIDCHRCAVRAFTEVELLFEIIPEFNGRPEWTPHLAAKTIERTDFSGSKKSFDFAWLK